MAGKKTNKNTVEETVINEPIEITTETTEAVVEPVEEVKEPTSNIADKVEAEVIKAIENVATEVNENIADIKKQEKDIMQKIEENPAAAQTIIENEMKRVDEMIKTQMQKMEGIKEELNNKKVRFMTTESWNGWGYDN
jgi:prophage DNA circulation protein